MSRIYTYSFEDTTVTIQHPSVGSFSAYGTGIGTLSVSMDSNITMHDVAADLAVVVSKSCKKNGSVTFNILQSSDLNTWMKKYYNYVVSAAPREFALATIVIKNNSTGEQYTCVGVSPQKLADVQYQSQAQNRDWVLMAANIDVA